MASKSAVVSKGVALRDALARIATDMTFSQFERDGFKSLSEFYGADLAHFDARPRYGDDSSYYDNALYWADLANSHVPACTPGGTAMQQLVRDATLEGGAQLERITSPAPTPLIRGALLLRPGPSSGGLAVRGLPAMREMHLNGILAAEGVPPPPGPNPPPREPAPPAWLAKLLSMFPAEAVTIYTIGAALLAEGKYHLELAGGVVVALAIVRWYGLAPSKESLARKALRILISAVSFALWVAATDRQLVAEAYAPIYAIVTMLWVWVIPVLPIPEPPVPDPDDD